MHKSHCSSETSHFSLSLGGGLAADDIYRQRALTDDTYRQRRDLVVDAHTDGRRELIFLLARRLQQTEAELDLHRVLLNAGRAQLPTAAAAATVPHEHVMEISTAAALDSRAKLLVN